ncbi:MAG: RNA polymerase factor sigma-54 [Blastocatellia bacterium]
MSFQQRLGINQRLDQRLTPQLIQRITMLQMTKLELSDMVIQEMGQNPVLEELSPEEVAVPADLANADYSEVPDKLLNGSAEIPDNPTSSVDPFDGEPPAVSTVDAGEYENLNGLNGSGEMSLDYSEYSAPPGEGAREAGEAAEPREGEIGDRDSFEEIDFGQTFEDYLDPGYRTRETEVKETPSFEQFLSSKEGLADHLNMQLRLTHMKPEVEEAAEAIVGNLNDDGYLDCSLEEIAALGQWPMETVTAAHEIVQQLDPTGVGARDLQECLLLQLKALGYGDRLAARVIRDHFSQLYNHKLPELARTLGVSIEQLGQELKIIRLLEPKPGRKYAIPNTQYIEPEVYIEKMGDDYSIRFNDDGLPQLRINRQYRQMMDNKETSKETRDYIKDRFRSAVDLMRNIEHRKQTIYKVCLCIVERQRDFLDKGVEHLRPMQQKDIAADIGMHLSTVSRVVNGKYAHTPQGVIELRRFFTEGMTNDEGEDVSTQAIKLRIRKMIDAEDSREPLTDEQIREILAKEGQKLSRRTVAKYREQMKIAGSRERRQVV